MKSIFLTIIFLMFLGCASQDASAIELDFKSGTDSIDTSVPLGDNGKCVDELAEYDRLLGITSASDEDKASALAKRDAAISKRLTGRLEDCETLMQEALDLIPE
jgi:hypothetical protein